MSLNPFTKRSFDYWAVELVFHNRLPRVPGIAIATSTVSAVDAAAPGVDVSNVVLQALVGMISGTSLFVGTKNGTPGHVYLITVHTYANDGITRFEDIITMTVADPLT